MGVTCDRMLPPVSGARVDETFPNLPEPVLFNDATWFLRRTPAQAQSVCAGRGDARGRDALGHSLGSSCNYLKRGNYTAIYRECTLGILINEHVTFVLKC